jgi:hypothetical protein
MMDPSVSWAARALAISGKVPVISRWLRDISRIRPSSAKARQRSPSSLRSKIQAGSENLSLVSVASWGSIQAGTAGGHDRPANQSGRQSVWLGRQTCPALPEHVPEAEWTGRRTMDSGFAMSSSALPSAAIPRTISTTPPSTIAPAPMRYPMNRLDV